MLVDLFLWIHFKKMGDCKIFRYVLKMFRLAYKVHFSPLPNVQELSIREGSRATASLLFYIVRLTLGVQKNPQHSCTDACT